LGVISRKLVTWVKDALCFKLYVYILKKTKEKKEKKKEKKEKKEIIIPTQGS
jgi:hypothetical protein